MTGGPITVAEVRRARDRIAALVDPTPVIRSPRLSDQLGIPVWLKLECLQPPGSFKVRGAASKMLALEPHERSRGVIACSGGNHGAAVAYVARLLGVPATVCVPESVDPVKLRAIRDSGAEAVVQGATYDDAERVSRRLEALELQPDRDAQLVAEPGRADHRGRVDQAGDPVAGPLHVRHRDDLAGHSPPARAGPP